MSEPVPRNPFRPGIGEIPPVTGRRHEIERHLLDMLGQMRDDASGAKYAYLYGPRGNGKTVLLRWTLARARETDGLAILRLAPDDLTSRHALVSAIGSAAGWRSLARNLVDRLGVRLGPGGPELSFESAGDPVTHGTSRAMEAPGRPLLITLDEAHTVPSDVLKTLLDTVQHAGDVSVVGVVLAGTPGLEDTLSASGASYWDRGEPLPVGRLDATEAERVIAGPFEQAGIATTDRAAAAIAGAADCYPYFLQVYGAAAWHAVEAAGTCCLGPDEVEVAIRRGNVRGLRYYRTRHEEFIQAGARALGRSVALAFRDAGGHLTERQMGALLAHDHGDGLDEASRRRFLRARGFIWQAQDASSWEPGIPSLMDYMISMTRAEPAEAYSPDFPGP